MDAQDQRWKTLWGVQRSVRYHARRKAFFDYWRRFTAGMSVLLGSAAAIDLLNLGGHVLAIAAAFSVSALAAVDLVVGTAEMSRKHDDLRRRFISLEAKILANESPDDSTVTVWCSERLAIESDEPPTYKALDLLCENEQALATGEKRRVEMGTFPILTAQLSRWENVKFKVVQTQL